MSLVFLIVCFIFRIVDFLYDVYIFKFSISRIFGCVVEEFVLFTKHRVKMRSSTYFYIADFFLCRII